MPPQPKPEFPSVTPAFDPWNSSSTGHQRAEGRGPLGWRAARNAKLHTQFRAPAGDGPRLHDGELLLAYNDGPRKAVVSVADMLRKPGSMKTSKTTTTSTSEEGKVRDLTAEERLTLTRSAEDDASKAKKEEQAKERKIFEGLVIYVNGSTFPLVSDHRLKQLLAENGAKTSLHLGRRQVTHVILGRPGIVGAGAGGGLAGGKLEKEIKRGGGGGVKFVGVKWVLESIKAGKRLPEARFSNLKIAHSRQQSVLAMFGKVDKPGGEISKA